MNASPDMSILSLLMHASVVVQAVLGILVFLSLVSWTRIFQKWFQLRQAKRLSEDFESRFWSGSDLTKLYEHAQNQHNHSGTQERIFAAGMTEFLKLSNRGSVEALDGVRRAMRATYQRELDNLERGLPTLASIGSVSPYVGLFGTVWGIMNAFTGLSALDNASLATVAPGIAEALVATAIGLFAAIPAVAAYNRFANDVERLSIRFESFAEEFQNILQRQRG
ncbi:MAG: protein TolQ [Burkholderiaceae bacterium]|nr:protein TolQ [Burkholderiaceae bacterium]